MWRMLCVNDFFVEIVCFQLAVLDCLTQDGNFARLETFFDSKMELEIDGFYTQKS